VNETHSIDDLHLFHDIAGADIVDNVQAFDDLPEAGMVAVEVGHTGTVVTYEELRSAGIAAAVGHAHHAAVVVLFGCAHFAGNGITRSAGARTIGTTALDHEIGDHPVKAQAVIKTLLYEFPEISCRDGCSVIIQFEGHDAFAGVYLPFGQCSCFHPGNLK